MLEYGNLEIFWDGHASVRVVDNGFTVAVDPFSEVSPDFEADIVLITHADSGHFDPGKIEAVCSDRSCVVVPDSIDQENVPCMDVEVVSEDEVVDIYNVEIEAVPMYNEHHDRGEGVGYRFVMGDNSVYVAGDTGFIEEAKNLEGKVDVAFLPVEGVFTMDLEEAIKMAVRIKPEITIPYHYGEPYFSDIDVDLNGFKAELEDRNINCEILESS